MSIAALGIRKTFERYQALTGVDLRVPRGKLVALLGPSGSGKTTLLRIIAGLESCDPEGGRILLHEEDVTHHPAGERRVGFVFQHYALFRHMTVAANIAFGLRVRPRSRRPNERQIGERVRELLERVQLTGLEDRFPAQLSGGQRQRVALARALAIEPRVLLLDEPFGALDAKVRKELRRWLRRFHDETQLTTVFVTHDQEEALEIADDVVIMNQGRIEQSGPPGEVYDRPASPFVYQFLGNVNVLKAGNLAAAGVSQLPAGAARANGNVYVRPHEIQVVRHAPGLAGIPAVVRHIHAAGPQARLVLEQVATREMLEVELSRSHLAMLDLKVTELVNFRLRQSPGLEDYAI